MSNKPNVPGKYPFPLPFPELCSVKNHFMYYTIVFKQQHYNLVYNETVIISLSQSLFVPRGGPEAHSLCGTSQYS